MHTWYSEASDVQKEIRSTEVGLLSVRVRARASERASERASARAYAHTSIHSHAHTSARPSGNLMKKKKLPCRILQETMILGCLHPKEGVITLKIVPSINSGSVCVFV